MNIKYRVEFHTDWHCGSGLAAGADVDALVIKDSYGLPFIPGKTMKGLIREAVEELLFFNGKMNDSDIVHNFVEAFGYFEKKDTKDDSQDYEMKKGELFFSNAELSDMEKQAIISSGTSKFLYRNISNTAIGENGIAKEHSLRKKEVVVPCILYGNILNVPESLATEIKKALNLIKRLGQNRNRGLGRCTITIAEGGIK